MAASTASPPSSERRRGRSSASRALRADAVALALALALAPWPASAAPAAPRFTQTIDFSFGFAAGRRTAALSWNHLYAPLPGRLQIGVGPRVTSFFADGPLTFRTGDPDLVREHQVNRLVVPDARVTSVNLQLLVVARLAGRVEAGFDIDLVGFSFGAGRTGQYDATDPRFAGAQRVNVSSFDLLLIDVRDRGQLNSELFLGVRLDRDWTVRLGASHVATEYLSASRLDHGNRRFRRFTTQAFVGVSRRIR